MLLLSYYYFCFIIFFICICAFWWDVVALFIVAFEAFSFFLLADWNNFGICDLWFSVAVGLFYHCIRSVKLCILFFRWWIVLSILVRIRWTLTIGIRKNAVLHDDDLIGELSVGCSCLWELLPPALKKKKNIAWGYYIYAQLAIYILWCFFWMGLKSFCIMADCFIFVSSSFPTPILCLAFSS